MNTDKIRKDFPVVPNYIYFDNACMSLKPRQVIESLNEYYQEYPACGGRSMHSLSKKVDLKVKETRKAIKKFIHAKDEKEIIFTRNTTEAINLLSHSFPFEKGDLVLLSDKEHNSNLLPWQMNGDIKYDIISTHNSQLNMEEFNEKIKDAKLVSMVHTSNIDGSTLNVKGIIKIAHENNALVHMDCAQSMPHKEVNVKKLDVDFISFSGHKMLGPTGTGILYGKERLLEQFKPFIVGGETVKNSTYTDKQWEDIPQRFEAGLQDYAGIIALKEAVKYIDKIKKKNIEKHEQELNKILTEELKNHVNIIGPLDPEKRSGIFSFTVDDIDNHEIALMLNEDNILLRSGMHCVHSWFNKHNMDGSVRASLYLYNTKQECHQFVEKLKKIINIIK